MNGTSGTNGNRLNLNGAKLLNTAQPVGHVTLTLLDNGQLQVTGNLAPLVINLVLDKAKASLVQQIIPGPQAAGPPTE